MTEKSEQEKNAETMRDQIADCKAALDMQAKQFIEWQKRVRERRNA